MIKNILAVLLLLGVATVFAENEKPPYDAALAQRLGADEYGMKHYVLAFLKAGPNRSEDKAAREELQKAHLKNIIRLAEEGKLIVAGPFLDQGEIEGIFIFDVSSVDEARKLTETDPAIKAGSLVMELHPWFGSAALVECARLHKSVEKKSVAD